MTAPPLYTKLLTAFSPYIIYSIALRPTPICLLIPPEHDILLTCKFFNQIHTLFDRWTVPRAAGVPRWLRRADVSKPKRRKIKYG